MISLYDKLARYSRSESTIVALHDRNEELFYNIYSVVEWCTDDQIKSPVIGEAPYYCKREKINNEYTLYIRRVFLMMPQNVMFVWLSFELFFEI